MTSKVESLWPSTIRPKILSPLTILRGQAEALAMQTDGLLLVEITSEDISDKRTLLLVEFVVPSLEGYRHRIMTVGFNKDLPYPCVIFAEIFEGVNYFAYPTFVNDGPNWAVIISLDNRAFTDQQFMRILEKVLQSHPVTSAAQSLIARATETLTADDDSRKSDVH